jgi:hypothetical protein
MVVVQQYTSAIKNGAATYRRIMRYITNAVLFAGSVSSASPLCPGLMEQSVVIKEYNMASEQEMKLEIQLDQEWSQLAQHEQRLANALANMLAGQQQINLNMNILKFALWVTVNELQLRRLRAERIGKEFGDVDIPGDKDDGSP